VGPLTGAVAGVADESDQGTVADATVQSRRKVLLVAGGAAIGAVAASMARPDPAEAYFNDPLVQGENHNMSPVLLEGTASGGGPFDALVSIQAVTLPGNAALSVLGKSSDGTTLHATAAAPGDSAGIGVAADAAGAHGIAVSAVNRNPSSTSPGPQGTVEIGAGVFGFTERPDAAGVEGVHESSWVVHPPQLPMGAGVRGDTSPTGSYETRAGVLGRNLSGPGPGVRGDTTSTVGAGLLGLQLTDPKTEPGPNATPAGVKGLAAASGARGVVGQSFGAGGVGVEGIGQDGIRGQSTDPAGAGVHGEGSTGVQGQTSDPTGVGVNGENTSSSGGTGVHGLGADTGVHGEGQTGVHGKSAAATGRGVHGEGSTGVHGESADAAGQGVKGENVNGDGVHGEGQTGVHGKSAAATGRGVHGEGSTGVHGESADAAGHGVKGDNVNGAGVHGQGQTGVHGHSDNLTGQGLLGTSTGPDSPGVRAQGRFAIKAESDTTAGGAGLSAVNHNGPSIIAEAGAQGPALEVQGAACFATVGKSGVNNGTSLVPSFPKGATRLEVKDTRVTNMSLVQVLLTSDPANGNQSAISWIDVRTASGFFLNLTKAPLKPTTFSYFIVESC